MAMTASVVKDEPRTTTVNTTSSTAEGHPFTQLQTLTNSNVVAIRTLNLSSGIDLNSPDDVTVSKEPLCDIETGNTFILYTNISMFISVVSSFILYKASFKLSFVLNHDIPG